MDNQSPGQELDADIRKAAEDALAKLTAAANMAADRKQSRAFNEMLNQKLSFVRAATVRIL